MTTSNRVSTLIQTLGFSEGRTSRASLSRPSSQPGGGPTAEEIDISNDDGEPSQDEDDQLKSLTPGPVENTPEHDVPSNELDKDKAREDPSVQSDVLSEYSGASFEPPLADGLHPRFNSFATDENRVVSASSAIPQTEKLESFSPSIESPSKLSALSSHPIDPTLVPRRSATVPSRRRTSFSPSPLDLRNPSWSGKDVVATPYPGRGTVQTAEDGKLDEVAKRPPRGLYKNRRAKQSRHPAAGRSQETSPSSGQGPFRKPSRRLDESLLVAVQDAASGLTRSAPLFIPPSPSTGRKVKEGKDDEELGYRMRDSYLALRGPWKSLFSARSVTGVHLHLQQTENPENKGGLETDIDLPGDRRPSTLSFSTRHHGGSNNAPCEELLRIFHAPSTGQGKSDALVRANHAARTSHACDPATIELVEGWSTPRIVIAFITVIVASIIAALLWIMLGQSSQAHFDLVNAVAPTGGHTPLRIISETSHSLPTLPGDRLEPGAMLGMLVLFLGWSFMGMWMFLSYLVG